MRTLNGACSLGGTTGPGFHGRAQSPEGSSGSERGFVGSDTSLPYLRFFFPGETCCPDKSWKNTEVVLQKQSSSNQDFRYSRAGLKSPGTAWGGLELLGVKPVQRTCSPPARPGCTKAAQRAVLWGCCFPLNQETAEPVLSKISSFLQ